MWTSSSVSCILESVEWNLALESVHVQLKWSDSYVHRLLMQQICSLCWIAILTRRYIFKLWYLKILNVASLHCVLQSTGAASYSKFVSREMSKAEALLKVNLGECCNDCWKALCWMITTRLYQADDITSCRSFCHQLILLLTHTVRSSPKARLLSFSGYLTSRFLH